MRSYSILLRILALLLSSALGAPAPSYALRPQNAGMEESPVHREIEDHLGPKTFPATTGLEEEFLKELQQKWPAITLRGRPPSDPLTKRLLLLASSSGAQLQRFYPGPVPESRIARLTRGTLSLLVEVREGWIGPWQGKEETLWAHNANWQWPWIEERLVPKRRKILLEGKDPLERIPLYRQVYEWLQRELKFQTQLTKADQDGLETASFYIAKLGTTALESAKEVIKVYTAAVPDLDLKKPEERLQFLIATYQRVLGQVNGELMAAGVEEIDQSLTVVVEAIHGPGVVVIDAAMFPRMAGLEELLKRLPAENRIVVVGAMGGSATMQEVRAWNMFCLETWVTVLTLKRGRVGLRWV